MKHITIGLLAVLALSIDGWGCAPYPPEWDEEHTDGSVLVGRDYYTVQPAPEGMGAALGSALDRWARATCLPLSVGTDGLMTLRAVDDLPGGQSGNTIRKGTRVSIRVVTGMTMPWTASVITHELYHALALRDDHPSDGVCQAVLRNPDEPITESCLERVCSVQPCHCFEPEM